MVLEVTSTGQTVPLPRFGGRSVPHDEANETPTPPKNVPENAPGAQASGQGDGANTTDAVRTPEPTTNETPSTRLSILYDRDSTLFVFRSIDADTGEVTDQYPSEMVVRRVAANAERFRETIEKLLDITV